MHSREQHSAEAVIGEGVYDTVAEAQFGVVAEAGGGVTIHIEEAHATGQQHVARALGAGDSKQANVMS